MKVEVNMKETSYGFVTVEVPDNATEEEINQAAEQAYFEGKVYWSGGDWEIQDQKIV